ncbi:NAD(P)H-binding protein [Maribacter halichondriae]|uniref:NmrA family NAD(P)-binding protein n=1 Tax=Maribacter halichondriae TaxID=2980554 RepID=UPI0023591F40|nr:NAD(P)H-binding protein [Maribacter sp. Hal144]
MKKEKILVVGGTGKTGRRIVTLLEDLGHQVRIGSRSASPAFDWRQPEQWPKVLESMDKVYITYQPDLAVPGAFEAVAQLVKYAKETSIKKLVLLSGKGEVEAQRCEQVVINSGLDHTIVRASWFNQNFSENFLLEPILQGVLALPQADVKIPFVDADDIAEVAVKSLLSEQHNGQIYQLTGSRRLTFVEAIEEIAEALGRNIQFIPISIQQYSEGMRQQGIPEDFVWLIEYLFTEVLGNPMVSETTNDIEKVLKRKPIDFSDYVQKTAALGFWDLAVEV